MLSPLKLDVLNLRRDKKLSSRQIADELGVTRNVVIGILSRLKKAGFDVPDSAPIGHKKPRPSPRPPRPWAPRLKIVEAAAVCEPVELPAPIEIVEGVSYADLRYMHCRGIIEEGPYDTMKFCGKTKYKRSYCRQHFLEYYVPNVRRKKSA